MKIKRAIILAAGRGSRLEELTKNNPKCLLFVKNQPVIERIIEVLKAKKIDDIIVVTGYKYEKLQYLKNKYNVKIVNNVCWENSNSIVSMYFARRYLNKNLLVIDSDIYVNKSSIIQTDIKKSGYTVVDVYRPTEWQFHFDENDNVSLVDFNADEKSLPILDISYWRKKDIKKISRYIKNQVYQNINNRYRDEIPCFDLVKQLDMKVYHISEDDAIEFDTKEELFQLRRKVND